MKILLIGQGGQVGFELQRTLSVLGEVTGTDFPGIDLADPASIRRWIDDVRPDVIVNAAAYTAVDKAESEPELARAINAVAPAVIGEAARALRARVIHYSTDYVYDGSGTTAFTETSATGPLCVYGSSKRDGDDALLASGADCFIFRTSWVFGAHGGNFVKTVLRLAAERETLKVVADQIGAPTTAALLADVTAQALAQCRYRPAGTLPTGIYHLTASGETSWHGFAQAIVRGALARGRTLKLHPDAILPIPTSDYPLPAKRPANSRLDTRRLQQTFGLRLPDWQAGLDHVLTELIRP
jgi:dTDP-4-dehydrorhamnose reductase